jgi:hypothetical protein
VHSTDEKRLTGYGAKPPKKPFLPRLHVSVSEKAAGCKTLMGRNLLTLKIRLIGGDK